MSAKARSNPRIGLLDRRKRKQGMLLVAPAVIILLCTSCYALGWAFVMSFSSNGAVMKNGFSFVFLDNYLAVLKARNFDQAILNTLRFAVLTIGIELVIGLLTAAKLSKSMRGTRIFQLGITTPMMIAPVAAAATWLWMFSDGYGIINHALSGIGLSGPHWLTYAEPARWAIIIVSVWGAVPFAILLLYAAQTGIPTEMFEAAHIDGASDFQLYWRIIFPQLKATLMLILIIRITDAIKMYDIPHVLTDGGPANATQMISDYIYKRSFDDYKFGEAAAGSYLVTAAIVAITLTINKLMRGGRQK